jgi:hypothetical protein
VLAWPPEFELVVENGTVRASDALTSLRATWKLGERVQLGGGEVPLAALEATLPGAVPTNCRGAGAFWLVGGWPANAGGRTTRHAARPSPGAFLVRDWDNRSWWIDARSGAVVRRPSADATVSPLGGPSATATVPAQTVLTWEGTRGGECRTLALDDQSLAKFGACGAQDGRQILPARLRAAELRYFLGRYQSFEAETPAGQFDFAGRGTWPATRAEQRALAEWAKLVEQELSFGRGGASWGVALVVSDGRADSCLNLGIMTYGLVHRGDCPALNVQPLAWLGPAELETLYRWLDIYQSFEAKFRDGNKFLEIYLAGMGSRAVTPAEQREIFEWAQGVRDAAMSTPTPTGPLRESP